MSDRDKGATSRPPGQQGDAGERPHTSRWEWVLAGMSAVIILGAVGALLYEAIRTPTTPPRIEIAVDTLVESDGQFTVEFRAYNRGNSTAVDLVVEGQLMSDTGSVETSSVTIGFVPAAATRTAGLIFTHDPRLYRLRIRPTGYDLP